MPRALARQEESIAFCHAYGGKRALAAQDSGFAPGHALWDAGVSDETRGGTTATMWRRHARNLADKRYCAGVC